MISQLQADEWALLRELRLAALTESPDAFSPTAESTALLDEDDWRASAERFGTSPAAAMFIARPDQGLMSAVKDAGGIGHIGAMWVSPTARGQKLGSALLDEGMRFLEASGCDQIELSVTETNLTARRLYESRGFVLTGESEPLRKGAALANLFMRRGNT